MDCGIHRVHGSRPAFGLEDGGLPLPLGAKNLRPALALGIFLIAACSRYSSCDMIRAAYFRIPHAQSQQRKSVVRRLAGHAIQAELVAEGCVVAGPVRVQSNAPHPGARNADRIAIEGAIREVEQDNSLIERPTNGPSAVADQLVGAVEVMNLKALPLQTLPRTGSGAAR